MAKRSDDKLYALPEVREAPPEDHDKLARLINEAHQLKAVFDDAEEKLKAKKKEIAEVVFEDGLCAADGTFGYRNGRFAVVVTTVMGREGLSRELLIENGVTVEQIKKSLTRGEPFNTVELVEISDVATPA